MNSAKLLTANLCGGSCSSASSDVVCFQSLRILKASDLKPYIVFIAPPNIEKLRQLRMKQDSSARITVRMTLTCLRMTQYCSVRITMSHK